MKLYVLERVPRADQDGTGVTSFNFLHNLKGASVGGIETVEETGSGPERGYKISMDADISFIGILQNATPPWQMPVQMVTGCDAFLLG